ncbi:NAD(P)-dependent oxidoreductase [Temperatibacter marinus]|uniref:NAD(P)-dependent oxidoreductase n=2 Tax=Temperatibacter marinus TaxID=1456591 RepID=A0AA52EEX5_9PROT|nr:NAD(P)-dependent oxidoreductase [Temperatibacter marinus]WND03465.1 NAD(P)-dependent oxidoreductase [Temperatibacter marinus]
MSSMKALRRTMIEDKAMAEEKMLKFVEKSQQYPDKRDHSERKQDFDEIYQEYAREKAAEQASRCSQCGVPFCQIHCPLGNNIPDWLRLTAEGRLEEAYQLSSATNNMPEICGRICPQDRLCEGNCVIEQDFDSVTIGSIEKYITDTAWNEGWVQPITPIQERAETVGIIGSGPAGLAAGEQLREQGFQVHIYERADRAGGLLIYGIPGFKLEKDVIERRTKRMEESGIQFHLNYEVESLEALKANHDALLIATGVYKGRELKAPGVGLGNVHKALDYLIASNKKSLGDAVQSFDDGTLNAEGKNVVVIGGGDTAMDCVRTAIRQGAKSVKCLYRRDRENMPGSVREVKNAEEEGVEFIWLSAPEAFVGADNVETVRAYKMQLGAADATGRQAPVQVPGSSFELECDMAILALGFEPEDLPALFQAPELNVARWGTVKVNHTSMMTNIDGIFAAGDIVRGASLVVWAIRDGRDVAEHMQAYIDTQSSDDIQPSSSVAAE